MMMNKGQDKINIEIKIAGERIMLSVPFDSQEDVRDSEKEIQELYSIWRERFPRKSDHELLAMIAYQYASYYRDLLKIHKQAVAMADECNSEARRMLSL